MILPFSAEVEKGRITDKDATNWPHKTGDPYGAFSFYCTATRAKLVVIASSAHQWEEVFRRPPWEHVSISVKDRCPTWAEMCFVKDLFFGPEECVLQFHPPRSSYVNCHPFVLHLWKPLGVSIPLPPTSAV